MPTKDGLDPAHALPRFLAAQAERDTGHTLDRAAPASRTFKASILASILIATAAAAIGIVVLAAGNPMALLAEGSDWLAGRSSSQSAPTIQSAADAPALALSTADAEALPPIAKDTPTRDEIVASEPAGKDQAANSESTSEALFRQFQAWAAEQDAQPRGGPVQSVQGAAAQVLQNTPAPAAENVRVPHRLVQKRRQVRAVRDARAEVRTQNLRKQVRRAQGERAERPPVPDARAQDRSAQATEAPSFLPTFGLRN